MAELAQPFIARAERYVLTPDDDKIMRYAVANDKKHIYSATLVNISWSGLAFVADEENAPAVGTVLKLEFHPPGKPQIAWWAKVVRTSAHSETPAWEGFSVAKDVMVGVQFQDLPSTHRTMIAEAVYNKSRAVAKQRRLKMWMQTKKLLKQKKKHLLTFAVCTILTAGLLYGLSKSDFSLSSLKPDRANHAWGNMMYIEMVKKKRGHEKAD